MKTGLACIFLVVLLLIPAGQADEKKFTCGSTGRTLTQFGGRTEQVTFPCKYPAVRQQCGDYFVSVTPGQRYLPPFYITSSLHVSVKDADGNLLWEGHTDYKVGAKNLYGFTKMENGKEVLRQPDPFVKISGSKETDELFRSDKSQTEVKISEKTETFAISFGPFDPDKGFQSSSWEFECIGDRNMPITSYPDQICDDLEGKGMAARRDELGFKDRVQALYYDVFTNKNIVQTNPKCQEVTDTLTDSAACPEERRTEAITRCYKILDSEPHAKCVTKFSCDVMDVFVDCVKFVCSNFADKSACERIGGSIDLCREFPGLSEEVDNANCYSDFVYRNN